MPSTAVPRAVARLARLVTTACALVAFAAPAPAKSLEEWIAAGDAEYAQARLSEARTAYQQAVAADTTNVAALCKLSRSESELGELQKGDEQRRTWSEAVAHARAATKLAPDGAQGHVWLAVALGRQALREGAKTKLALSREIKSEVDRAIQLDPSIGRAWHVRAMWNVKLASLNAFERGMAGMILGGVPPGASYENAERDLKKAIELEPDYVNHRLEYGRLLRELKRNADARRELEKAVSLPATSSALDARYQAEARTLLAKLPKP